MKYLLFRHTLHFCKDRHIASLVCTRKEESIAEASSELVSGKNMYTYTIPCALCRHAHVGRRCVRESSVFSAACRCAVFRARKYTQEQCKRAKEVLFNYRAARGKSKATVLRLISLFFRWNWHEGKLDESLPKVMVDRMPILYVTAVTSKDKKNRTAEFGQYEPYDCPVYKYPKRTDNYLVFRVNLRTEVPPSHWKLRGTALLCSTE